ncbi:MAG: hypothetical protein J2P23_10325 [Microlunatus sp.]|nr:hypothetical protein [Microlunatus sp.]
MRRILVPAAVVVLLAGCAQQTTEVTPLAPATAPAGHGPQSITLRVVEQTLARAPLPPGTRTATAAEAAGKQALNHPAGPNLVDRHATYVVPLGLRQATDWFTANPPPGLRKTETSSERGSSGVITAGLGFTGRATVAYDSLAEEVAIYPLDHSQAVVRVDGLAVWLPQRSRDERVPGDATAVQVVRVVRAGAKPRRITLTGPAVRDLARVLNRQRPISPGPVSCPASNGAYDILHFTGATPDPIFTVDATACRFITVTTDGVAQPTLHGGDAVDATLTAILAHRR